jgi:UDP-N-acetylmuramoylalanine--D-glutamate ligase
LSELISILGAGESGVGSAILAHKKGYDVWVSDFNQIKPKYKTELDEYGIKYEENGHDESKIKSSVKIIKSPGISDEAPIVLAASSADIPIISEIEFAAGHTDASLIGITGTNGKTTTTMLTYNILKDAGLSVGLAGNVGYSFAKQVALEDYKYYVLELSSFQLEGMHTVALDYAVLLNISPDHLDRYATYQDYIDAKLRINLNQDSSKIYFLCR